MEFRTNEIMSLLHHDYCFEPSISRRAESSMRSGYARRAVEQLGPARVFERELHTMFDKLGA